MKTENPYSSRIAQLVAALKRRKLDALEIRSEANIRAFTGLECDNAILLVAPGSVVFHTDFRYIPMAHRLAPWLKTKDIKNIKYSAKRIGFEPTLSYTQYRALCKRSRRAKLVDIGEDIAKIRMIKTPAELEALEKAERLNDEIWAIAQKKFRPGMTELDMARTIRHLMIDMGEGEAFSTIVCVGKNAAECHHVPDGTVWDGKEPVLVDMGVKKDGYCADMTRNIVPAGASEEYKKVYEAVLGANEAAIAAARPGMKAKDLDKVARDYLKKRGFGKYFGHSLGHGVGVEIHEAPAVSTKSETVLKEGMVHSIEPGVYIENKLGVRIEDVVAIEKDGCRVFSQSAKSI